MIRIAIFRLSLCPQLVSALILYCSSASNTHGVVYRWVDLCPGPLNGTWCPACESVLKVDPAGATIGLRPLLLLTCIALCIKLGWGVAHVDSFDELRGSEPYCFTVRHFGSYILSPCVKSQKLLWSPACPLWWVMTRSWSSH